MDVHDRNRYQRSGCRCEQCVAAQRDYVAAQRERRKLRVAAAMPADEPSTADRPGPDVSPGPVVAAVEAELAQIGGHESRPGLAAACVTLGRLLDNPGAYAQWASAARQLQRGLDELHKGRPVSHGRLRAVQRMTERPDAG